MKSHNFDSTHHLRPESVPLFLLVCWVVVSACGLSTPTPVAISIPIPTIVPGRLCELTPGERIPLAVSGVSGSSVIYRWSASDGLVTPLEGPAVSFIAPNTGGQVIITVTAERDGQASQGMITCQVIAPDPIPTDTLPPATLAPTFTPIPIATTWECTSYRSQKPIEKGSIPGQVRIDTPLQGSVDIPYNQSIQAAGTYTEIPAGKHVWVFIYSPEGNRYYPQTGDPFGWQPDPTTGSDGRWTVDIGFGAPSLCYEVIVMVAEPTASRSIDEQIQEWTAADNYIGYVLNGPSADNAPVLPDGLVEKASVEVKTR